jgi:ABC-type bacteriocin/lantibiotic exporter with double-glycine peptidase domain
MSQPVLIKILVDNVIPDRDLALFTWVIAGIVSIYLFGSLFTGLRSYLMAWFGQKVVYDLRAELYEHIQALSLEFFDRKGTGWVMDRVTSDTTNLQDFVSEGLQDFLRDTMTLFVIITIMFIMNWSLALMTLIPAPLVVVLTVFVFRRTRRLWHAIWRKRARTRDQSFQS